MLDEHGDVVERVKTGKTGGLEYLVGEVLHGHAGAHGGGKDVDAFVDAVTADDLGAEDAPLAIEEQFHVQLLGAGIVGGV